MPLQATSGAASYDAFGGGVAAVPNYIEECFSTTLYTGNGSTQTITNGIDLSTKGGLVWIKGRDNASTQNNLYDTNRGIYKYLQSNTTDPQTTDVNRVTAFNSNGFSIGAGGGSINRSPDLYASWTFRRQPKFFDVVTYTGTGSATTIAHNLGSVPGCIIVKKLNDTSIWSVYHTSIGAGNYLTLNTTDASGAASSIWNSTTPTSTEFTVGTSGSTNGSGNTFVAYLFAHNAGGFGLTGTDNVISCGSFTTDASANASVTLGYEPQWVLIKRTDSAGYWDMLDNMRGMTVGTSNAFLWANTSDAEMVGQRAQPFATGFNYNGSNSASYIYIAIRRGPMKVPTSGTSVFYPNTSAGTITTGFPVDTMMSAYRSGDTNNFNFVDRLRGFPSNNADITNNKYIVSSSTVAETITTTYTYGWNNTQYKTGLYGENLFYSLGRAPGFFDEVCYTGTGSAGRAINHNLGVAPELVIVKNRSVAGDNWEVLCAFGTVQRLRLNLATAGNTSVEALFGDGSSYIAPTSTTFTVANLSSVNGSGSNLVAYLFATCAGVSKVGSYTGNGSSQTINCGFTGGARFVLIKRTDSTGDWYVWDTARGIVSANDPHLSLNTTAAEVTTDDTIDTDSTGFIVNQVTATNVNVSSATYIYLAIA